MQPILIVADHYSDDDVESGRPFSGAAGSILRGLLSQTGIEEQGVRKTAVFPFRPAGGRVESLTTKNRAEGVPGYNYIFRGNYIHNRETPHLARLWNLIESLQPNIIVAMGSTALWATTGRTGVDRWRGSPMPSVRGDFKVICTWPPSSIMRQWELRPIVYMDLLKAKRESETRRLSRPSRVITLAPFLADIAEFYERHVIPAPFISLDVETKSDQITEVGIATSPRRAIVIPFWGRAKPNYWETKEAELEAWAWVRRILQEKPTIGQNLQYDMQYFYRKYGITTPNFIGDTMLAAHTLQPEMKKGLGFLGSIYTDEPSWKFMRTDHTTLKQEDD
jgi:uracil-DNA glycosylase